MSSSSAPSPTAPPGTPSGATPPTNSKPTSTTAIRSGPEWDRLRRDLAATSDLCAVAHHYLDLDRPATHPDRWAHVAETAELLQHDFTVRQHQPEHPGLERSIGVELGL